MLLPSLSKKKSIDTFLINCFELLTNIRWINEAVYAQWKNRWDVFAKGVVHCHKMYTDSWSKNIVAVHKFINPDVFVKGIEDDDVSIDYFKYKIKT